MSRLMIFVDGSNLFHAMDGYRKGYRIDVLKMIEQLKKNRELIRTYYFASTVIPPIKEQTRFYDMLSYSGIKTIIKPLRECGGRGRREKKEKGVDVSLATNFLSLGFKKAYDIGMIVSGDQDYIDAIKEIQGCGLRVEVASFKRVLSDELHKNCDRLILIDDFADQIAL